jgi:hypothetical protein
LGAATVPLLQLSYHGRKKRISDRLQQTKCQASLDGLNGGRLVKVTVVLDDSQEFAPLLGYRVADWKRVQR